MTGDFDPRIVKRLSVYTSIAALSSVAIGLVALIGWTLHIAALFTWGAAQAIAPNSAACMVLAGVSLWLLRKDGQPSWDWWVCSHWQSTFSERTSASIGY
jgi:hypothetical protein